MSSRVASPVAHGHAAQLIRTRPYLPDLPDLPCSQISQISSEQLIRTTSQISQISHAPRSPRSLPPSSFGRGRTSRRVSRRLLNTDVQPTWREYSEALGFKFKVFDIFDGNLETACGFSSPADIDYIIISSVLRPPDRL